MSCSRQVKKIHLSFTIDCSLSISLPNIFLNLRIIKKRLIEEMGYNLTISSIISFFLMFLERFRDRIMCHMCNLSQRHFHLSKSSVLSDMLRKPHATFLSWRFLSLSSCLFLFPLTMTNWRREGDMVRRSNGEGAPVGPIVRPVQQVFYWRTFWGKCVVPSDMPGPKQFSPLDDGEQSCLGTDQGGDQTTKFVCILFLVGDVKQSLEAFFFFRMLESSFSSHGPRFVARHQDSSDL